MADLYRLHLGPVNAAYYQRHFQRFESRGKATLSWNHGAAFCTLAWLLLRKLWRPAGLYVAVLAAWVAVWGWGLHGRVPLALEAAAALLALLLLCVLPGVLGNALYYQQVRRQTLDTLTHAPSLSQARAQLASDAITPARLQAVAVLQALVALGLAAAWFFGTLNKDLGRAAPAAATPAAAVSGPPELVIPAAPHLPPLVLPAFSPAMAPVGSDPTEPSAPPVQPESAAPTAPMATSATTPDSAASSAASLADALPSAPTQPTQPTLVAVPAPASKATKTKAAPTAAKSAPAASASGSYYLNAGVYAQTANVDAAAKKLHAAKLKTVRQTVSSKNGELTRLRIGPFATRQQAEQAAAQARRLRIETTLAAPSKP